MPTALVLTLRPHCSATVAPHLGRASQAALLHALADRDAALARRVRQETQLKPFTVSDLLGTRRRPGPRLVTHTETYQLRWVGLSPELEAPLRALAAEPPASVLLDDVAFRVERATIDPRDHLWAGTMDWSELARRAVERPDGPHERFALQFVAPTTFRSRGQNLALPLPELVFGSLLDRWNRFAPAPLPVDVRHFAAEALMLGRYQLQSHRVLLQYATTGGGETAFTGTCTFIATTHDRHYLRYLTALLDLAFWSGIGAKTSLGLGLVRWEPGSLPRSEHTTMARVG